MERLGFILGAKPRVQAPAREPWAWCPYGENEETWFPSVWGL